MVTLCEPKSPSRGVIDLDKLVAKINWSFNRWKGFDWEAFRRRHESGFEFVRRTGYAHEWWNFYEKFSRDNYYGSIITRPQKFGRGFVFFISRNPLDGKWYFVGFYSDAVMPPDYVSTGVPMRDLLPEVVVKDIETLVKSSNWKDRHLAYLSRVLSGEEYRTVFVAPKECSASFLPEAYIEVHPEDIGVGRVEGQWKITYKITRSQIERLLTETKRRHEAIGSEEAKEIVRRIDRALAKLRVLGPKGEEKKKRETQIKTISDVSTVPMSFPEELLESYEPVEFLGEGGFAKVFRARRKDDGTIVAIKIPHIDRKTSALFIKEVAAWYNLNHENIVRLYKADILPRPYLEMELVEGAEVNGKLIRNLDEYPKPVDEKTALSIVRGIAKGLAHAHSKGIYHLDLKPLNILLKANLTPKITDWGLAKISARSSLSRHYGYSPLYAAPEQLDEETFGTPDHRTDIYQLGLIFYELLTGKSPYEATSPASLFGKILQAKPMPPSRVNPALAKYDGIFERLLAKQKEERYQSVDEFIEALDSLEELNNELDELKRTKETLKRSRSGKEIQRLRREIIEKTAEIAVLRARLNDKAGLLNALEDLKFYTWKNLDDLLNAIAQVEMLLEEGIPVGNDLIERLTVLLHRIQRENDVF